MAVDRFVLVLYPSLGSARFGSFLARAFGQKARLGSARSISQKARFEKIRKNNFHEIENFENDSNCLTQLNIVRFSKFKSP